MNVIIYIFGPSAAGKSTVALLLQRKMNDMHVVDFDIIKREINNYDWKKHAELGRGLTIDSLCEVTRRQQPILLLYPPPRDVEEYSLIKSVANKSSYKLVNVEITAPNDVLLSRYTQRLKNIEAEKRQWKFKTIDEFKAKLESRYYAPKDTVTFNSSQMSSEDIAAAVLKLI